MDQKTKFISKGNSSLFWIKAVIWALMTKLVNYDLLKMSETILCLTLSQEICLFNMKIEKH